MARIRNAALARVIGFTFASDAVRAATPSNRLACSSQSPEIKLPEKEIARLKGVENEKARKIILARGWKPAPGLVIPTKPRARIILRLTPVLNRYLSNVVWSSLGGANVWPWELAGSPPRALKRATRLSTWSGLLATLA